MRHLLSFLLLFAFSALSADFSNKETLTQTDKKKIKKVKYRKKQTDTFFYTRSLNKLQNSKGIRPYDFKYKFGAQASYDIAYVNEADQKYVDSLWRRIRVYTKGSFFDETLFYELEYSFTGNSHYKDIYLGYQNKVKPIGLNYRVKFGNIKVPFSLERYSSSKNLTFMERSLNNTFGVNRKLAGELLLSEKIERHRVNLLVSAFSSSIDDKIQNSVNQPGASLRATYSFKVSNHNLLSLGGGYLTRDMKGETIKFKQGAESKIMKDKYLSVKIKDVQTLNKTNLEALYIYKNYSLQAEYETVDVQALIDNYSFNAYYLQASYFLFGATRRYSTKEVKLKKIKPLKGGALELAARYSYINLNDEGQKQMHPEHGGEQTDYNFALNYYYSKEIRGMINYIIVKPKGTDDYDGRLQILQARILLAF